MELQSDAQTNKELSNRKSWRSPRAPAHPEAAAIPEKSPKAPNPASAGRLLGRETGLRSRRSWISTAKSWVGSGIGPARGSDRLLSGLPE